MYSLYKRLTSLALSDMGFLFDSFSGWKQYSDEHKMSLVDVVLGLIALTSGKRSLKDYAVDMKQRGQTK